MEPSCAASLRTSSPRTTSPTNCDAVDVRTRIARHERRPVDDIEAIQQLKARYFRTMDTKDWTAMRDVFTDDLVMDGSDAGGRAIAGADVFMAFLQRFLEGAVTVHHGHMPEITITS